MKATHLLKRQHESVQALFTKVESGDAEALDDLASALVAGMAVDREVFYPAVLHVDQERILDSFMDQATVEVALKRVLSSAGQHSASFHTLVAALKSQIERQVVADDSLLQRVEEKVPGARLESIGTEMERRFYELFDAGYAGALADVSELALGPNERDSAADSAASDSHPYAASA